MMRIIIIIVDEHRKKGTIMEQKKLDALFEKLEYKKGELNKKKKSVSDLVFANTNMDRLSNMSNRILAKEKQVNRKFKELLDSPNRIRVLKDNDELKERFIKTKERWSIESDIFIGSFNDAINYLDRANNGMHLDRDLAKNKMSTIKENYTKLNGTLESMLQF